MTIEQMIPQLLEHVDIDQWERPARLLLLVARRTQMGDVWAPITPADIRALGRSGRQAAYDHDVVMVRMAERDRVLRRQRRGGRQSDLWRINPNLRSWRHVPGIPTWSAVESFFSVLLTTDRAAQTTYRAGQTPLLTTGTPPNSGRLTDNGSVGAMWSAPPGLCSAPQRPAETPRQPVDDAADRAPSSQLLGDTSYLSHSLEREGGSEDVTTKAGEELLARVARLLPEGIWGTPATQIRAVGAARAGRIDELVRHLERKRIRTATGMVSALHELTARIDAGVPLEPPETGPRPFEPLEQLEPADPELSARALQELRQQLRGGSQTVDTAAE